MLLSDSILIECNMIYVEWFKRICSEASWCIFLFQAILLYSKLLFDFSYFLISLVLVLVDLDRARGKISTYEDFTSSEMERKCFEISLKRCASILFQTLTAGMRYMQSHISALHAENVAFYMIISTTFLSTYSSSLICFLINMNSFLHLFQPLEFWLIQLWGT